MNRYTAQHYLSLLQSAVLTCLKSATTIISPKGTVNCLDNYCPVALTPIIIKYFERLILSHIKSAILADLDQHQLAYRANRSTEDAVSTALHTILTHLDQPSTFIRVLFVDFSSAFNAVITHKLSYKLSNLGLGSSPCTWILDFLSNRPQIVRMGGHRDVSSAPSSTPSSPTTAPPSTQPTLSSNLLMTQPL